MFTNYNRHTALERKVTEGEVTRAAAEGVQEIWSLLNFTVNQKLLFKKVKKKNKAKQKAH